MKKEPTIHDLIKTINTISYSFTDDDSISIKIKYLLLLKREIERLQDEISKLEVRNKFLDKELKVMTGKLIECKNKKEPIEFEAYF